MTKSEFLTTLHALLSDLDPQESDKAILFYEESINDKMEDGLSEEQAVESLGDVREIAAELTANVPLSTLVQHKIKASRDNAANKGLWIVLAICGIPIWLPLSLSLLVVILVVYLCIWVLAICLFIVLLSLLLCGIALALASLTFWHVNPLAACASVSAAIFLAGLFLLGLHPILFLSKQLIACTGLFLRKIKSKFITKKELAL